MKKMLPVVKKNTSIFLIAIVLVSGIIIWQKVSTKKASIETNSILSGSFDQSKLKTDTEWRQILTHEQYRILREKGTETPFTGELLHEKRKGTYFSVGCDEPLFHSEQKYDSGTGWPSFTAPITKDALVLRREDSIGDDRIEVLDRCGGHLGHVFDDGPEPTGKRYCINSMALKFVPDEEN